MKSIRDMAGRGYPGCVDTAQTKKMDTNMPTPKRCVYCNEMPEGGVFYEDRICEKCRKYFDEFYEKEVMPLDPDNGDKADSDPVQRTRPPKTLVVDNQAGLGWYRARFY